MHTRIKYNYEGDGLYASRQVFNVNEKDCIVMLDYNNFKFEIIDIKTKECVVSGGKTKNKAVLKRQAKRALKKLGFEFNVETRKRTEDNGQ